MMRRLTDVCRGRPRSRTEVVVDQAEIFFSVVPHKVVSPNDFTNLAEVEQRLSERYNATATPLRWKFTRDDLHDLLTRISQHEQQEATVELPPAA